jgi:integrase
MAKLTKRVVDAAPVPPGTPAGGPGYYFLWDTEIAGFGLRVRSNGRKTYELQYRDAAGASRRVLIGEHGPYTAEQARAAALRLRADVLAARRDPTKSDPLTLARRARRQAHEARSAPSLAEVADAFLVECAAKLKASTAAEYRRLLGVTDVRKGPEKGTERVGELRAALGRLKIADVTRSHVAKLHLEMAARPYQANRSLATLSALFQYAERHGYRPDGSNPCRGVAHYRETRRERYLTDAEFAALGAALAQAERQGLPIPPTRQRRRATAATSKHRTKDSSPDGARPLLPLNPVGLGALRFLLLSGWREREALTLEWGHVAFERGVATLPETKTGRSVRELGAPALAVLEAMRKYQRLGSPFVFPGSKDGAYFTDTARIWDAVRHAAGLPDVRLHDLRHAFASVAASGGLTLPLIGALLGHVDVATTARYAHLVDSSRKRAAEMTSRAVAAALGGVPAETDPNADPEIGRVVLPLVRAG